MDVPKPEPQGGDAAAARPARCSRNDGKQWRCKSAAVPGYIFCDWHIAWSTRKRKRRAKKDHGSILEPTKEEEPAEEENDDDAEEAEARNRDETAGTPNPRCNGGGDDGFYYYCGFQPGSRKRARSGGAGPA